MHPVVGAQSGTPLRTVLRFRLWPVAPRPQVLPSLRLWLQSSSLLAVLAGYVLLLALNQGLNALQRSKAHRELVVQLVGMASAVDGHAGRPPGGAQTPVLPGVQLRQLPGVLESSPRLVQRDNQSWIESATPLLAGPSGAARSLVVRQDVSASLERQNLAQALLIAAAGLSALVTGGLLRPVLRRGLVQPLEELGAQIHALQPPPAPSPLLLEAQQPQELRPIAAAFNAMQARLGASWEQQRAFVDGLAHELRNPLTLISGHAQSLQRQPLSEDVRTGLRLIDAEAQRMALLVSDLLDLARRDAGRLELSCCAVNPEDALLETLERLAPRSGGRLGLLSSEVSAVLPAALVDPERLQQCLAALIDNALRYSPAPQPVHLAAEVIGDALVLHVRDRGPGVASDERERIFERFVRGAAAVDTRGSGLGLSIVRLLIEAMGGRVLVVDAEGGGADFQLHLPRA